MKKLILALLVIAYPCLAQSNQAFPQKVYWASDYGTWSIKGQSANTYQFSPPEVCEIPATGTSSFVPFAVNAPLLIQDALVSSSEVVTPSSIISNASYCGVVVSPVHSHYTFNLVSATGGLQEALNQISVHVAYPVKVILDRNWYVAVNNVPGQTAAAVIASAKGNTAAYLEDDTQSPNIFYTWNGTAYIAQSTGGGATTPATNNLLKGNGSANGVVAATPGTDFLPGPGGSPIYGMAPIFTGTSANYTAQPVPLQFGSSANQYITQQTTNSNYTTLAVNNLNNTFNVDGYANGNYAGIGASQVAWSSGANKALCQAVSFGGLNYMAIDINNGTITPGTNASIWAQVPNAQATTTFDCGAYQAMYYATGQSHQAQINMGIGRYSTNGLIFPSGLYSLSIVGCGNQCSYLTYTGSTAVPMFSKANGSNFPSVRILGMTMDGNQTASSCQDLFGLGISREADVACLNVAAGSDHFIEWGNPSNISFAMMADNVSVNTVIAGYGEPDTYPVITANIVGGAITSYTIVSGGHGQPQSGLAMYWFGTQGGTSKSPCTTLPTQPTLTYNGSGVLTGITPSGSNGTGCSGTVDVQIHSLYPVNYGFVINNSDSTYKDLYCVVGKLACIQNLYGNNLYLHAHPQSVLTGIQNVGSNSTFDATELDAIYQYGFDFEILNNPSMTATVVGTQAYTGGRLTPGMSTFYFGVNAGNVVISANNSLVTPGYVPVDYHEFMTQTGPIDTTSQWSRLPSGVSVVGNDPYCCAALGDYDPLLTVGSLSITGTLIPGAIQTTGTLASGPTGTATSGANFQANLLQSIDSWWNGSSVSQSTFGWSLQPAAGSNPNTTATLGFTNCPSGGCTLNVSPITFFQAQGTFAATERFAAGATFDQGFTMTGTPPTITGCGTISAQHGGAAAGDFTTSTAGTCSAAFALPTAAHGYFCNVVDITKHVVANIMLQSATSTTGCTVTGTTAASDVLTFSAIAY